MHLPYKVRSVGFLIIPCQCPSSTGNFLPLDADWSNTIIAGLALAWSIFTFVNQKNKDRAASLETERLRQQTIRLEWYKETVKSRIDQLYADFEDIKGLKAQIKNATLTSLEVDELQTNYKTRIYSIRDHFLEPLLYVHNPTYKKLKNELDLLVESIANTLINDELKLSHDGVYEREIGSKIKTCQQRFYQILYSYRGEE